MAKIFKFPEDLGQILPTLITIIVLLIIFIALNFILNRIRDKLEEKARTKKQISNVEIFSNILKYALLLVFVLSVIFYYSGSFMSLGLILGLFSAALGFALQKPITSIAGWIMIIVKRPFEIGDRVIIGEVKGDVTHITLTHIYLNEVGGLYHGEEKSGRIIMVPNWKVFEHNIINYSLQDDYVLGQVTVSVTYESNLDKAIEIAIGSAKKCVQDFGGESLREPYTRVHFRPSGIDIKVRYFVPFGKLQEAASMITKEIYDRIIKAEDVEIAYPHTEIIYRKKE